MSLRGVALKQRDAVYGGGCADIFMGDFDDGVVALKSLRIFNKDEINLILQVSNVRPILSLHTYKRDCRMFSKKLSYGDNLITRILHNSWDSVRTPFQIVSLWFLHGWRMAT